MAARSSTDRPGDDGLEAFAVLSGILLLLLLAVWFVRGEAIVKACAQPLYALARPWGWLPADLGNATLNQLHAAGSQFLKAPGAVGLEAWIRYTFTCMLPLAVALALLLAGSAVWTVSRKTKPLKGVIDPTTLARRLAQTFTGTMPILHLRKKLVSDADPLWRRQTAPHEVLLHARVGGRPLVVDGKADRERIREWLLGLVPYKGQGRGAARPALMVSTQLGHQVVDLTSDPGKKGLVYADRMSSVGKVIYGLLVAWGFGGDQGRKDYLQARDQLNRSAALESSGRPNLTVAQWLYDKYRDHADAKRIFRAHHWEYTVLWALLVHAKRQGKVGHWDWLWLKPMARTLFYCMNTIGRLTPHAESAAAFGQYVFERRVAKRRRLPLAKTEAGMVHVIYVEKAVDALVDEWERWQGAEDPEQQDWWMGEELDNCFAQVAQWQASVARAQPEKPPPGEADSAPGTHPPVAATSSAPPAKAPSGADGDLLDNLLNF